MSADINMNIRIKKNDDKVIILNVIKKLKEFTKKGEKHFQIDSVVIKEDKKNASELRLENASEEDLDAYINNIKKDICINGMGPYGNYESLLSTNIFQSLANVNCGVEFEGSFSGFNNGGNISLDADMHDGMLHLIEYFELDEDHDKYINFFEEVLDFSKFCDLFEINEDDYDIEDYEDFLPDFLERLSSYPSMDLEEFLEYFDTSINEDKYEKILEELSMFDIASFETYNEYYNLNALISYYVYNPANGETNEDVEQKEKALQIKKKNIEQIKSKFNNKIEELISLE